MAEQPARAWALLRDISAYSALLYVFGFLAVRARLVALGVWTALPVLDANYLTEGGLFLVATTHYLLIRVGKWLLLAGALFWIPWRAARRFRQRLSEPMIGALRLAQPWLQLASLLGLFWLLTPLLEELLNVHDLLFTSKAPAPTLPYEALLFATGLLAGCWYWLRARPVLPRAFAYVAAALTLAAVFVYLPIGYALNLRCGSFPEAEVALKDEAQPRHAALVLLAGGRLVLYERTASGGSLQTLAEEQVKSIRTLGYLNPIKQGAP